MSRSSVAARFNRATTTLLAIAVAAFGLVVVDLATTATPAAAASSVGGTIKRSEILERAKSWVDKGYTYSQSKVAPDPQGRNYRTDCSGLVAMAWHITDSPDTNAYANTNGRLNGVDRWKTITGGHNGADAMKPGDAMVYRIEDANPPHGHIEIFAGWKSPADHTQGAWVYSFNSDGETVQHPNANNNSGHLGSDTWSEILGYERYIQYANVVDDTYGSTSDICVYRALRTTNERQGPSIAYRGVGSYATNYEIYLFKSITTTNGSGTWRRVPDTKGLDSGGGWMNMADWTQVPNYPCEPY